jgi:glycosyltransferase involved in cell wall biosynthesis
LDVPSQPDAKEPGVTHDFPRILVVTGNNFNLVTGGGITLTNLFRGWPADRLANVHDDVTPVDRSVCRNFYRLTGEEIRWVWPFSLLRRSYGRFKDRSIGMSDSSGAPRPSSGASAIETARRVIGDSVPKRACLTKELTAWIEQFQPTLLYGFLGSLEQVDLTRQLAKRWAVPLVVHMMDDWPAVLHTGGLLGPVVGPLLRRELQATLREATGRFAICEQMCEEYQQRYGYPFLPFQNALEIGQWLPDSRTDWKAGTPFVLRYVGSIVPDGQRDSLRDIARAVARLSADGLGVQLRIHAPAHESAYLRDLSSSAIRLEGPPDPTSIARLLAGTDLLVLPYNFDARSARYIRLSLPTKAPAYMISGTPILVYAPGDVATARYAAREGWGHVVATRGEEPVMSAIRMLMQDAGLREQLGRRAKTVAAARHDASVVKAAFWAALCEAARQKGV